MRPILATLLILFAIASLVHGAIDLVRRAIRAITEGMRPHQQRLVSELMASCRHANRLYRTGRISRGSYIALRNSLDDDLRTLGAMPPERVRAPGAAPGSPRPELAPAEQSLIEQPTGAADADIAWLAPAEASEPLEDGAALIPVDTAPIPAELLTTSSMSSDPVTDRSTTGPATGIPATADLAMASSATVATRDEAAEGPRRAWGDLLQGFMEERNIRWGELISGMLIVGSVLGLVISLRQELQRTVPYFPALLFLAATAAVQGAGWYTSRRWRLRTTSRGAMVIGLLLVPLGVLGSCLLSSEGATGAVGSPSLWGALVIGLIGYTSVTWLGASTLVGARAPWFVAGVVLGAAAIPAIELIPPGHGRGSVALAAWPVAAAWLALWGYVRPQLPRGRWHGLVQERFLIVLGVLLITMAVPIVFVGERHFGGWRGIRPLAPVLTAAAALLAAGCWEWRRHLVAERSPQAYTGATAGVLLGAVGMVVAVGAAWPLPWPLVEAGGVACALCLGAGVRRRSPESLGAGLVFLAPTVVVLTHLLLGTYPVESAAATSDWLVSHRQAMSSGISGITLSGLSLLVVACCAVLARRGNAAGARALAIGGGATALAGLASAVSASLLGRDAFDRTVATSLLALHGAGALAASCRVATRPLVGAGALLWLGAACSAFVGDGPLRRLLALATGRESLDDLPELLRSPWRLALLAHAAALTAVALAWAAWGQRRRRAHLTTWVRRLQWHDLIGYAVLSALAAIVTALGPHPASLASLSGTCSVVAGVWWVAAGLRVSRPLFAAFQAAATAAFALAVADTSRRLGVWTDWREASLWHLEWLVLALSAAAWRLLGAWEWLGAEWSRLQPRRDQPRLADALLALSVLAISFWSAAACAPGVRAAWEWSPSPRAQWFVGGDLAAWCALATAAIAIVLVSRREGSWLAVVGWVLLASCVPWRVAALWGDSPRVAELARWGVGLAGLVLVGLAMAGAAIDRIWRSLGGDELSGEPPRRVTAILAPCAATLGVVWLTAGDLDRGHWAPGTWPFVSESLPVVFVALAWLLAGRVLRRDTPDVIGAALAQFAVWSLLVMTRSSLGWSSAGELARWLSWSSVGAGLFAVIWQLSRRRATPDPEDRWAVATIVVHLATLPALLGGWAILRLVQEPGGAPGNAAMSALGSWTSHVGLLLAAGILWVLARRGTGETSTGWMGAWWAGVACCGGGIAAATIDAHDTMRIWLAYHLLMTTVVIAALGVAELPFAPERWRRWMGLVSLADRRNLTSGGLGLVGLATLLAARCLNQDPLGQGWACGVAVAATLAAVLLAFKSPVGWLADIGAVPWLLAGVQLSDEFRLLPWERLWLLFALWALYGLAWFALDRWARRGEEGRQATEMTPVAEEDVPSEHRVVERLAAWLPPVLLLVGGMAWLSNDATRWPAPLLASLQLVSVAGVLALAVTRYWRLTATSRGRPLYLATLATIWLAIGVTPWETELGVARPTGAAAGLLGGALHLALAASLWRRREPWGRALARLGGRIEPGPSAIRWLLPVTLILGTTLTIGAFPMVLHESTRTPRVIAALAPLATALALSRLAAGLGSLPLALAALTQAIVGAVLIAWADLAPAGDIALARVVRMLTALALSTGALAIGTRRVVAETSSRPADESGPSSPWPEAVRIMLRTAYGATLVAFLVLLAYERREFDPRTGTSLSTVQAVAVVVYIGAMIAGLVAAAVAPRRDPLGLPDWLRVAYTYAAEAVAALLVAHVYWTTPWVFLEEWRPYWPWIVMGLAFAAAGVGELLARTGLPVLGEPLFRTSFVLPLLPLLGMLVIDSSQSYTLVLLLAALLFLVAAAVRGSTILGLGSAVLGNLTLWSAYRETGLLPFLTHPQFWLVPPAVSALIAGQLNRQRLSASQLTSLRYLSIAVIYLSSTSEVFIGGLGARLGPPMVLATLAVLGVFAGILIHVRAFLYFGATFLFLSIVAMVSHARQALGHVWPWWAFGITLGVAILVLFGIFEKRRDDVRQMLGELRDWEA